MLMEATELFLFKSENSLNFLYTISDYFLVVRNEWEAIVNSRIGQIVRSWLRKIAVNDILVVRAESTLAY